MYEITVEDVIEIQVIEELYAASVDVLATAMANDEITVKNYSETGNMIARIDYELAKIEFLQAA